MANEIQALRIDAHFKRRAYNIVKKGSSDIFKYRLEIQAASPEFFTLIKGFNETFSQHIQAKQSFMTEDTLWKKQFLKIFVLNSDHAIEFDINHIKLD